MQTEDLTGKRTPLNEIRQLMLEQAVLQGRQDLGELKEELHVLYEQVCLVRNEADEERLNRNLRLLEQMVKHFLKGWNAHIRREENELFPYAASYWGEAPELLDYMEQDYELAENYIQAFLHELSRSVIPVSREEARRMTSYLLQAYAFLKNRFDEEDDLLDSLTDRSNRSALMSTNL